MLSKVPATQTAIIQYHGGSLKITSGLPVPELDPHHILVRTASVALNPCDFKMPMRFPTPGLWDGCDFSGTVCALGSKAAGRFHIGDRVFGAVQGSNLSDPASGSYCEYLRIDQDFVFRIPKGTSFEVAPALSGTGIATLGVALFWSLQIPGSLEVPSKTPVDILVYGASSTIGLLAIQMVKLYVFSENIKSAFSKDIKRLTVN
jgi:NADPH:quinone reductase-like Zn-dependent oxidoreductase